MDTMGPVEGISDGSCAWVGGRWDVWDGVENMFVDGGRAGVGAHDGVAGEGRDRGGEELCLLGMVPRVTRTGLGGGWDAEGGRTGGARTIGLVELVPKVTVLSLGGEEVGTGAHLGDPWTTVDQVDGGGGFSFGEGRGGCLIC